jgi:hypothetical protein
MNIAENMMGTIRRVTRNVKTSVLVVVDSFFHAISYFKDEAAWRSTPATAYERQSRMTSEAWTARAKLAWIGDCRCAVPIAYSFNPSAAVPAVRRTGSRSKLRSPRGQPRKVPTSRVNKQRYDGGGEGARGTPLAGKVTYGVFLVCRCRPRQQIGSASKAEPRPARPRYSPVEEVTRWLTPADHCCGPDRFSSRSALKTFP